MESMTLVLGVLWCPWDEMRKGKLLEAAPEGKHKRTSRNPIHSSHCTHWESTAHPLPLHPVSGHAR